MAINKVRRSVVGGLAVLATGSVIGLAATQPLSVAAPVELAALIVVGSSTNQSGAGVEHFYRDKFNPAGTKPVYVNFGQGPDGIYDAVNNGERDVVLSSGWGASNASQVIAKRRNDSEVTSALWILDNSLNIPNGGFATRYPIFSSLVLIDPTPTPVLPDTKIVQVRYEYDINSNAPAYVLNVAAMANTLAGYLERRLNQADLELPIDADGNIDRETTGDCSKKCTATLANGQEVDIKVNGRTTYVTYRSNGLPLTNLLRTYGGEPGRILADLTEPALKAAVDYGYPDNDPSGDPEEHKPARLVPTAKETATFAADFGKGVQDGLGKLSDRPSSSKAAVEKPKAKPRTDVVTKSPFFKPGEKPATTKTGTTDPDPLKTFTDAVQKSMSDLLSGPKTAAEPKDSTEKTADDTPSADKPAA